MYSLRKSCEHSDRRKLNYLWNKTAMQLGHLQLPHYAHFPAGVIQCSTISHYSLSLLILKASILPSITHTKQGQEYLA